MSKPRRKPSRKVVTLTIAAARHIDTCLTYGCECHKTVLKSIRRQLRRAGK